MGLCGKKNYEDNGIENEAFIPVFLSYENFTKSLQLIKETGLGDFEQSGDQKDATANNFKEKKIKLTNDIDELEQKISQAKTEKSRLEVEIGILHEMLVCRQLDIDKIKALIDGKIDEISLGEIVPDL